MTIRLYAPVIMMLMSFCSYMPIAGMMLNNLTVEQIQSIEKNVNSWPKKPNSPDEKLIVTKDQFALLVAYMEATTKIDHYPFHADGYARQNYDLLNAIGRLFETGNFPAKHATNRTQAEMLKNDYLKTDSSSSFHSSWHVDFKRCETILENGGIQRLLSYKNNTRRNPYHPVLREVKWDTAESSVKEINIEETVSSFSEDIGAVVMLYLIEVSNIDAQKRESIADTELKKAVTLLQNNFQRLTSSSYFAFDGLIYAAIKAERQGKIPPIPEGICLKELLEAVQIIAQKGGIELLEKIERGEHYSPSPYNQSLRSQRSLLIGGAVALGISAAIAGIYYVYTRLNKKKREEDELGLGKLPREVVS